MAGIVLSAASRLAGLMFLPPGRDDELLLAVDDAQVAVLVEQPHVPGVERAVGVEGLGRLVRVVEVAGEHVAAPAAHLAVVGQDHLDAGERPAHGPDPHRVGVPGHRAGGLGQAVDLRHGHADGPVPADQVRRDGGGAGHRELDRVEPHQPPHLGERHLVEERPGGVVLGGGGAGRAALDDGDGGRHRLVEAGLGLGVGGQRGLDAGVELLPHPGHPEHGLGVDLAGVGGDLRGVRAGGDLEPGHAGQVVAGHPLGHVRHGQVGDEPEAGEVEAQQVEVALGRPHDVAVRQHHALGRAGGPRRVDDGGQHVGRELGRPPRPGRSARWR